MSINNSSSSESNGHIAPTKQQQKEQKLTRQLRERLNDLIGPEYDDFTLRKWLKARQFDLNKAEQMFRESDAYKKKMNVQSLLDDYEKPEVIRDYLTGGFCGHDKEGSPVRVELFGRLDLKGIMAAVKKSDLEKSKLLQCEWTVKEWERQSKKLGKQVDGLTVIMDMEGTGTRMLWRPGMQMYLHLVKVLEDNYPEMLKYLLVINAPAIFPLLYKLARPLVSDDMKKKIHVIGGDYKNYLLKYIDADQLPACFGGTLTDPDGDPRCKTMICQGGDVPAKFYMNSDHLLEHMTKITVPRADQVRIPFVVDRPGCILRWEFKTENYDIGFGVMFQEETREVPIVPIKRVNSHVLAEDGSIQCDRLGTYTLWFDNSFSWARSKTVFYVGEVMVTDDGTTLEINDLIEGGDWATIEKHFLTTHL